MHGPIAFLACHALTLEARGGRTRLFELVLHIEREPDTAKGALSELADELQRDVGADLGPLCEGDRVRDHRLTVKGLMRLRRGFARWRRFGLWSRRVRGNEIGRRRGKGRQIVNGDEFTLDGGRGAAQLAN